MPTIVRHFRCCRSRGSSLFILALLLLAPHGFGQERRESEAEVSQPPPSKLFSGPQPGEKLPSAAVWVVRAADQPSVKQDPSANHPRGPLMIAFMHERTRPAFGLARLMSNFVQWKKEHQEQERGTEKSVVEPHLYVVVLSEDRSSSEQWLRQVRRYFGDATQLAVAEGGIEGPGSLGLNRLVSMTILVVEDQQVVANFALTQVSDATDGPAVLKAMNEAMGGGEIPELSKLNPGYQRR